MSTGTEELPTKFDERLLLRHLEHYDYGRAFAWTLEQIHSARTAHLNGSFEQSYQLAIDMRKDAAIYAALKNRIAPIRGLPSDMLAPKDGGWTMKARGAPERIREEAAETFDLDRGDHLSRDVVGDIVGEVAMLGLSVWQVVWTTRSDGSRLDTRLEPWPLSRVAWQSWDGQLLAVTSEGMVPVEHGDGKWIVFRSSTCRPWQWGAVVPLGLCWVDRAFGIRDRQRNAEGHGSAKAIGIMPPGVRIDSPEGAAMLELLQRMHKARSGGIIPSGAELKWIESMSQSWQIYREILNTENQDIPKILLGQDGTSENGGGNYKKASMLWGVRNDMVESDVATVTSGLWTGLFRPWTIVNFGAVESTPKRVWHMPDADEDARRESYAARMKALGDDITRLRAAGCEVDQAYVDGLAREYGVQPPKIGAVPTPSPVS